MSKTSYSEQNKETIKARAREYYYKNRESKMAYAARYQKENKEKKRVWAKKYRDANKAKRRAYIAKNKDKINAAIAVYTKRRENIDPSFKLANRLRHRVNMALKGNFKTGSAIKELGCSVQELKKYLEKQFLVGMSWDNYAYTGWHIDHIVPLAYFDLTNVEQFKAACHYTNLQPMWAYDNIIKRDEITR
jgi:hypothetical protein